LIPSVSAAEAVRSLVRDGVLTPEQAPPVVVALDGALSDWVSDVAGRLTAMAREWEEAMGDDDKTYYSLALRRAVDVVTATSAFDVLPVLERPDTPDE